MRKTKKNIKKEIKLNSLISTIVNLFKFTELDFAAITETSLNVLAALSYDILYEVTLYLDLTF